jgi:hypothetical protein
VRFQVGDSVWYDDNHGVVSAQTRDMQTVTVDWDDGIVTKAWECDLMTDAEHERCESD